ncbi:MAG: serine/threonine protein phosphatase PrpC [Candidatus Pseudothioglobus sp.]|jgi:serine/threonine protein phosphatase PrpC
MANYLTVSLGQYSDKGRKAINQDYHGATIPQGPMLTLKGVAIAMADGISSSDVSQVASKATVQGFLDDYYRTSETWSVKKSAHQVLTAVNSWLHAQTQKSDYRFDKDKGYVCTFSALIIKSTTVHLFSLGDTRIYRLRGQRLEQLTVDHRLWESSEKSYLSRAMGLDPQLEIDYDSHVVLQNDIFILMTDGIYEILDGDSIVDTITTSPDDLNQAARQLSDFAYARGSTDNLSVQILRIDALPMAAANEITQEVAELSFPPILQARMIFDQFTVIKEVHASSRSHVYLAVSNNTQQTLILKTPSIDLRDDAAYLERFLLEEWIAKRINSAHVLKPCAPEQQRRYLYTAFEFIDGQTLTQWMIDNPKPSLESVRGIVEQIGRGLQAFHRLEMLHQDLRPANIMIDKNGVVKIIDFGATRVAGLREIESNLPQQEMLGTMQYSAPEYLLGEAGTIKSDLFSLAVITYQMLTGRLPYGARVARAKTRAAQNRLRYKSALHDEREIPAWIDETLEKALHPNPDKRYGELSEFLFHLRQPTKAFLSKARPPLIERNPIAFWQGISAILLVIIITLLLLLH